MDKKILVAIPVVINPQLFRAAITSVLVNRRGNVDLLIIDNNSDILVKQIIYEIQQDYLGVIVITNAENIFVNPAWNQMMQFFLKRKQYDYLCIMNSDLVLQNNWYELLNNRWQHNENEIIIPNVCDEISLNLSTEIQDAKEVNSGTAGIFITLNREQCNIVYPIPNEIKVWFGDEWIYTILRNLGYKTVIPNNFIARHEWSSTVSKLEGIHSIIEQDKVQWATLVSFDMLRLIENKII